MSVAFLVAALAVALALLPGGSGAAPPAGNPLSTVTENPEPADFSQPGVTVKYIPMADVQAGRTYTLEFSGSITRTNPDKSTVKTDSLYQYERSADPSFQPTRCCIDFVIQGHEDTPLQPDHYPQQSIPFDTTHEYEATFVPPFSGKLGVRDINRYQYNATPNTGSVRIELFAGAPRAGGGGSTAGLPFGTTSKVDVPAPGGTTDISTKPLPHNTKQVDLDAEISDAQVDAVAASLLAAIDRHNKALAKRRQQLKDLLGMCVFYGSGGAPGTSSIELTVNERLELGAKIEVLELGCKKFIAKALEKAGATGARAAASGCGVGMVPIFKRREKAAVRRAAVAAVKSLLKTSCTSAGPTSLAVHVAATKRGGTLNRLLGGKAAAGVTRRAKPGAADGPNPQLSVTWRAH